MVSDMVAEERATFRIRIETARVGQRIKELYRRIFEKFSP